MWCDMDHNESIDCINELLDRMCSAYCINDPTEKDGPFACNSKMQSRCQYYKAVSDAKKALRKQIGMRPKRVHIDGFWGFRCYRCKQQVWINYLYCPNCGQRLKWESEKGSE